VGPNSIIFVVFDIFLMQASFPPKTAANIFFSAAAAKLNFSADFRRTLQNVAAAEAKFGGGGV